MLYRILFLSIFLIKSLTCAKLGVSNEEIVIEAIRENRNLILLFVKKDCIDCKYEQALVALQQEVEDAFDGKILKLENSHMQRIYDYNKHESALVFLRKGVPLLYPPGAKDSADDIFDFFSDNREPVVKELDDSNFEHLTQASTGSTTGDWLVQFYDNQCIDCNRLTGTWESVGATLKRRMNVARVNRATKGTLTASRFKAISIGVPEIIFLRSGKFYTYSMKQYDVQSFVGFATSWYTKVTPEKVIAPATPFENLVDTVVKRLKEVPNISNENFTFIAAGVAFGFLLLLVFLFKKPKSVKKTESEKTPETKKVSKKEK